LKKPQKLMCLLSKKRHILCPGIPGRFTRETGNEKIPGFPGKRERDIPGSKAYNQGYQKVRGAFAEICLVHGNG
jgi:hypothetical protein